MALLGVFRSFLFLFTAVFADAGLGEVGAQHGGHQRCIGRNTSVIDQTAQTSLLQRNTWIRSTLMNSSSSDADTRASVIEAMNETALNASSRSSSTHLLGQRQQLSNMKSAQESTGGIFAALAKVSSNVAIQWDGDIFGLPKEAFRRYLHFADQSDWLILWSTVFVLVLVDYFIIQKLVQRTAPKDGQSANSEVLALEAKLRGIFTRNDVDNSGFITRQQVIVERQKHPEVADLFPAPARGEVAASSQDCAGADAAVSHIGHAADAPMTWEEFRDSSIAAMPAVVVSSSSQLRADSQLGGSTQEHLLMVFFWVCVGAAFNLGVAWSKGADAGYQWCSGYFLEWLLSVDNLFVFHLIFKAYKTPKQLMHKAVFIGIFSGLIMRMCFFEFLHSLLHLVRWVRYIFGVVLIYSGVQAARDDDGESVDVEDTLLMRLVKRCLGDRLLNKYDIETNSLFLWVNGKCHMTLLVPVIVCLELTDIVFAVDSVTAKVAQIPNYFIAYSSSVIAVFSLRAIFFIIEDLVDCFETLKYGLCFILVFIGIELLVSDFVQLPAQLVCVVVLSVFAVCVAASTANNFVAKTGDTSEATAR